MNDLLLLAGRCEAAAGAYFDLNSTIARSEFYRERFGDMGDDEIPDFGDSIDAAMTIIPDGFHIAALGFCPTDEYREGWYCELVRLPDHYFSVGLPDGMNFHAEDPKRLATPGLAICAAALRARHSLASVGKSGDSR